jgi:transposase InsO family protein
VILALYAPARLFAWLGAASRGPAAIGKRARNRVKARSPQTNGVVERLHKTMLNEFYRVAFRKNIYRAIEELRADLDAWTRQYNAERPHQGRWCYGKTPMQTFLDSLDVAKEKLHAT